MAVSALVILSALFAHELGHALCALAFGSRATIVLHALGGYTQVEPRLPRAQEIITHLMGPIASIALGASLFFAHSWLPSHACLPTAMRVSLAWGVMHLLPVLPFDGGKILLSTLGAARHGRALWVSGAVAVMIAVEGLLVAHSALLFFVFGVAALSSLSAWATVRRTEIERRLELPAQLARGQRLLERGRAEGALELAHDVAARARSNVTANEAFHLAAWAQLELGLPSAARTSLLGVVPSFAVEPFCLAATEAALGRTTQAVTVLEREREEGALSIGATKLLIDCYARLGLLVEACSVAKSAIALLEPADTRRVIAAALEQNAAPSANELAAALFQRTGSAEDAALALKRGHEREPREQDASALGDSVV